MIRDVSFTSAIPVASALAAKGLSLAAVPSTVLSDLVTKSAIETEMLSAGFLSGPEAIQNYGITLWMATDDKGNVPSPHSMALGGYVDDISGPVMAHIAFAKSVVKPLVE